MELEEAAERRVAVVDVTVVMEEGLAPGLVIELPQLIHVLWVLLLVKVGGEVVEEAAVVCSGEGWSAEMDVAAVALTLRRLICVSLWRITEN